MLDGSPMTCTGETLAEQVARIDPPAPDGEVVHPAPGNHAPSGVVHGGLYSAAAGSAASIGTSPAGRGCGEFAVAVHNETDFPRSETKGTVDAVTEAIRQGRSQQLWLVTVTRRDDGQQLARTHVRLHDVAPPTGKPRRSEEGAPRS